MKLKRIFMRQIRVQVLNSLGNKGLVKSSLTGAKGWVKRIVVAAVVVGLVFFIGTIALFSYTVKQVSTILPNQPSVNLVALEHFVADKTGIPEEDIQQTLTSLTSWFKALKGQFVPETQVDK
jgi:preprotein translocase subunit SecG